MDTVVRGSWAATSSSGISSVATYIINLEIAGNLTMVLGVENTGTRSKPISGASARELGVTKM